MNEKENTLCWTCKNACGNCSWSRKFQPVENWEAIKDSNSFTVISCPQYQEIENRCKKLTIQDISKLLHCSPKFVRNLCDNYVIHKCKSNGYNIFIDHSGKVREFFLYS